MSVRAVEDSRSEELDAQQGHDRLPPPLNSGEVRVSPVDASNGYLKMVITALQWLYKATPTYSFFMNIIRLHQVYNYQDYFQAQIGKYVGYYDTLLFICSLMKFKIIINIVFADGAITKHSHPVFVLHVDADGSGDHLSEAGREDLFE